MAIRLTKGVGKRTNMGQVPGANYTGLRDDFAKYEREIFSGKIECPFTVEFKNTAGEVICNRPVPLTPNGKPKINLFGGLD